MCNFLTPLFIFAAFILALLVSLSLPIIKSISLFSLILNVDLEKLSGGALDKLIPNADANVSGKVIFGLWGYCIPGIRLSVSAAGQGTSTNVPQFCTPPQLGYTIDQRIVDALGNVENIDTYRDLIAKATTGAFVLHCIVAVLAFLTLLLSLSMCCQGAVKSRVASGCTLGLGILSALIATVIFLLDVIFVAILRNKITERTQNEITADWGNGVWMMLGATVALWLGVFGACGGICCGNGRKSARY